MPCVRWGSTRTLTRPKTPNCTPTCLTTCTWSSSEPRGTSTSLASRSSCGCTRFYTYDIDRWQLVLWHWPYIGALSRSVMRRVITLINQLAVALGTSAALQTQAESANKAAKKYMEDNEMLKQVKGLYLILCSQSDYAILAPNIGWIWLIVGFTDLSLCISGPVYTWY